MDEDAGLSGIERARSGDPEAFGAVFHVYRHDVRRLCRRILGDEAAAEDAVAEVFLRAQERLASYDASRPFRSWLLGIAAHHCIDLLRRRSRFAPFTSAHFYVWLVIRVGSAFILGMLLYALVPGLFAAHLETAGDFGRSLGIGFLITVVTPIALFLIGVTLLGIPLALVGLAIYVTSLYVSGILIAALLGTQITHPEPETWRSFGLALLVGLVIVIVATAIPFVGLPIRFVVVLTGLGLVAERVRSGWRVTRHVTFG